jgi:hypothetical protein
VESGEEACIEIPTTDLVVSAPVQSRSIEPVENSVPSIVPEPVDAIQVVESEVISQPTAPVSSSNSLSTFQPDNNTLTLSEDRLLSVFCPFPQPSALSADLAAHSSSVGAELRHSSVTSMIDRVSNDASVEQVGLITYFGIYFMF